MTIKRNVHPARRARVLTAITSVTSFLAVISSLAWNTHVAEATAAQTQVDVGLTQIVPVETVAIPLVAPIVAAPVINPTPTTPAVSNPTSKPATTKKAKVASTTSPAVPAAAPIAPAAPTAAPAAPTAAPAAPAAPTVVYTCMSPGGTTESPTSSGTCKNARYGYVLTQI